MSSLHSFDKYDMITFQTFLNGIFAHQMVKSWISVCRWIIQIKLSGTFLNFLGEVLQYLVLSCSSLFHLFLYARLVLFLCCGVVLFANLVFKLLDLLFNGLLFSNSFLLLLPFNHLFLFFHAYIALSQVHMLLGYLIACQRFKVTFLHHPFNSVLDWLHFIFHLVVQTNHLQMDFVQHDKTRN